MPKRGLQTPFQRGHDVQFGLLVTERDERTSVVRAATCRFCLKFGREAKPGAKRKRTAHVQVFTVPFRTDTYTRHHISAHPVKWAEFQQLAAAEKATFFDGAVDYANTLLAHLDSEGPLILSFNRDIVEDLIGDLLYDVDDEDVHSSRSRALSIFKEHEDAAATDNEEVYSVKILSVRRFKMVLGFVAKGASFRSASRFVDVAREVTKLSYLRGCSEGVCATYVRIICAASLQSIHDLLRDCWAYSIALDVGHAQGTSYLDVRVRLCTSGRLVNLHVVALPLHTNKTAEAQFNTASKALNVVDKNWRDKLVSIGTDGERTMTGRISGVQTRFEEAATFSVVRIWCGLHQLDLAAQKEYMLLGDDAFVTTLTALISYLRRQQNLQAEMKTTCPKFVSTRWLSMKRVTAWLAQHRVRVTSYLEEKNPACKPSVSWWIVALCLDAVATELADTYSRLQGLTTLLSQQYAQFGELCANLSELCAVSGPLSDDSIAQLDPAVPHVRRGAYVVTCANALSFVRDQGLFVLTSLEALPGAEVAGIVESVANLFAGLHSGIKNVLAVRDSNNRGSDAALPPVLPHSLVKVRTAQVSELVRGYASRLQLSGWSQTRIEQIEKDHKELMRAYRGEVQFKESLDACSDLRDKFCDAWALCGGRFGVLREFAGGLASMFPNTATVEADFSLIGYEKDEYRQSLTDFSLEGILHAKQFDTLRDLSAK